MVYILSIYVWSFIINRIDDLSNTKENYVGSKMSMTEMPKIL